MPKAISPSRRKPINKVLKVFLITVGLLFTLWVIGRVTHAFQYYKSPSAANYPALEVGDRFFSTNLLSPERNDLVCYEFEDPYFGKHVRVHRVSGLGGDTVELKEGILFVNGKNADEGKNLAHSYLLTTKQLIELQSTNDINQEDIQVLSPDSALVTLADDLVRQQLPTARRYIVPAEQVVPEIKALFKGNWNTDHFGPVVVPAGHYFLMGDNRHASQDSRYIGFIAMDRIKGTVIGK